MFLFFVEGLEQQVRQVQKTGAGKCIICGSSTDLVEYEKVLKIFFVPVLQWPGKEPLMRCSHCSLIFPPAPLTEPFLDGRRCASCDGPVESNFRSCPSCGSAL